MNTKIKIEVVPGGRLPRKAHTTDAAWDVFPRIDKGILVGDDEVGKIPLGFKIEIPEGFVGLLVPRSSNTKTRRFQGNSPGVIDAGFNGEVLWCFRNVNPGNHRPFYATVEKDKACAQLLIVKLPSVEFVQVDEISKDTDRGEGGFGSTDNNA